jgi:hypothetical protein
VKLAEVEVVSLHGLGGGGVPLDIEGHVSCSLVARIRFGLCRQWMRKVPRIPALEWNVQTNG